MPDRNTIIRKIRAIAANTDLLADDLANRAVTTKEARDALSTVVKRNLEDAIRLLDNELWEQQGG